MRLGIWGIYMLILESLRATPALEGSEIKSLWVLGAGHLWGWADEVPRHQLHIFYSCGLKLSGHEGWF